MLAQSRSWAEHWAGSKGEIFTHLPISRARPADLPSTTHSPWQQHQIQHHPESIRGG